MLGRDLARTSATLAAGAGLGAGLMYLFDPHRGSWRRTHLRNQVVHASHRVRDTAGAQLRSLRRAPGVDDDIDDDVLVQRVQRMLGRAASHARAIAVEAANGVVTVSGPVLGHEAPRLLKALRKVRAMPGVRRVEHALELAPATRGAASGRRIATALALAGLGFAARASMRHGEEFELRS